MPKNYECTRLALVIVCMVHVIPEINVRLLYPVMFSTAAQPHGQSICAVIEKHDVRVLVVACVICTVGREEGDTHTYAPLLSTHVL